jgi:hypothetical protein
MKLFSFDFSLAFLVGLKQEELTPSTSWAPATGWGTPTNIWTPTTNKMPTKISSG